MPTDLAVCYVGDLNFLLGSLISLRSLRQFVGPDEAEIYVFYIDPDPQVLDRVQRAAARFDATVLPLSIDGQASPPTTVWNKTHVPRSTLGRFFFEPQLPAHTKRLLYIDGDTLFVRDPRALFRFEPPEDALAAVEDISHFARHDWGRYGAETRRYFAGLGIDAAESYFNAGVLYARREAWKSIAAEARQFFEANSEKCLYHDQSAFNAVIGRRRVPISSRWNFQTTFCYWGVKQAIDPCILHFTEFPKPWMGDIVPWTFLAGEMNEAAAQFAELELPTQRLSLVELGKVNQLKLARAQRLKHRMRFRLWRRRREIFRLSRQAVI